MTRSFVTTIAFAGLLAACGDDSSGAGETDDTDVSSGASTDSTSATSSSGSTSGTPTTATSSSSSSPESSSSETADSSGSSSGGETGPGLCPDVGDPCTTCESTQCPDAYCSCFNNGSCVLLAQCAAACDVGDQQCNQDCWTQYPEGISDGAVLTDCAATTCEDACGSFTPLTECQLCLYTDCAEAMNTCVSNPECFALLGCLDACEDPGCENTCYAVHPDGLADSGPVGECAQDACLVACS